MPLFFTLLALLTSPLVKAETGQSPAGLALASSSFAGSCHATDSNLEGFCSLNNNEEACELSEGCHWEESLQSILAREARALGMETR